MYYLNSRYYNPEIGRSINADDVKYLDSSSLVGMNLYAYCQNNPVMLVDPNGKFVLAIAATLLIGTVIGATAGGIVALATGEDFWAGVAGGATAGLISTAGMALAITTGGLGGLAIAAGSGFASGFTSSVVTQGMSNGWDNISYDKAAISGGISAAFSVFTYGLTNFAMREEATGLFDDIFDTTKPFITRYGSALSFSGLSLFSSYYIGGPMLLTQMFWEIYSHPSANT